MKKFDRDGEHRRGGKGEVTGGSGAREVSEKRDHAFPRLGSAEGVRKDGM